MIPKCLECNQEMVCVKESQEHKKTYNRKFRIRRFHCSLCNYSETIYADGTRDMIDEPNKVLEDIEQYYNQQEDYVSRENS